MGRKLLFLCRGGQRKYVEWVTRRHISRHHYRSADIPVRSNVFMPRSLRYSAHRGRSQLAPDRNVRAPARKVKWVSYALGAPAALLVGIAKFFWVGPASVALVPIGLSESKK